MPDPSADRFTVLHLHAQGGLGQVSLALDEKLKRQVALKELRPERRGNPNLRRRFLAEAEITGQLEHPGIVPIYDLDVGDDGEVRYAMRFVRGCNLGEAIRKYHDEPSPLAFRGLLRRFVSVCETIAYAHSQGVIHRDLKPANVMLGDYGETLVVDWGLAKRLGPQTELATALASPIASSPADLATDADATEAPSGDDGLTQAGQVLGTPAYMAPEQAAGDVESTRAPADVYGLGAILYEVLTGGPPYAEKTGTEVLTAIRHEAPVRPARVRGGMPAALEAVCLRAMARDIRDRYPGAAELARDVERWLADEPVTAYREPLRLRFARWRRRHHTKVIAAAVLLGTALVVGGINMAIASRVREQQERSNALARVEALREAAPATVPVLLSGLDAAGDIVRPRLRRLWDDETLDARQRRRVGLALLAHDPAVVRERLLAVTLETDDPQEFLLVRDRLAPHMAGSTAALWDEARRPATGAAWRFRLLVALAAFDPWSPHWPEVVDRQAEQLLAANSLHIGYWAEAMSPMRQALLPPLRRAAKVGRATEKGLLATRLLLRYAADRPDVLIDHLLAAGPAQYEVMWPDLSASATTEAAMRAELTRAVPKQATDAVRDELASRQANAAVTLLRMGKPDVAWPLLRTGLAPRLRTYLIHRFAELRADPGVLLRRLPLEKDTSARQALLLSLGDYAGDRLSAGVRGEAKAAGLVSLQGDPDPGVHSAARWLLRRLGHDDEAEAAEKTLVSPGPAPGRRWYVTPEGHTMAVVTGPTDFRLSVYVRTPGGKPREVRRPMKISYSFAVATRKVTLGQFRRFLSEHPEPGYAYAQPSGKDEHEPATQVTWLQAAKYCRWLSEREKIPEEQMCFPKIADIKEGMALPADYARRTGYRLPLSAEWECACRAGTETKFAYGSDAELLGRYCWHSDNTGRAPRAVGLLKPNDLGLFDVYGLAYEWCYDRVFFSPGVEERVFRGSTRFLPPELIATSGPGITANRPTYKGNENGLRVVRTLP